MERLTVIILMLITTIQETAAFMFLKEKLRGKTEMMIMKKLSNDYVEIMKTFIIAHKKK